MALENVAVILRAGQLYAHHAHNNCRGQSFFEDHSFFGSTYSEMETDYDDVVERMINATGMFLDTISLDQQACELLKDAERKPGQGNSSYFSEMMKVEKSLCLVIDQCIASKKYPEGTIQLLGDISDRSMKRQYKISQRIR